MAVSKVPSKQLGFKNATSSSNILLDTPCDISVYIGAAVYLDSGIIRNAIATSESSSYVIGFCYNKSSSASCDVILSGISAEIFASLDTSKIYFLSDTVAGGIQDSPVIVASNYLISLGKPLSDQKLVVKIGQLFRRS